MTRRSGPPENDKALRDKIIGLGDQSYKKSYYSELQRKLAELERFKALLDQSNDAVFMLSLPSGQIIDINETACRMLHCDRETFLLRPFQSICQWFDRKALAHFMAADRDRTPLKEVVRTALIAEGGERVPVEISARLVRLDRDSFVVTVARDITETLKAEAALRKLNEELERRVTERTRELTYANEKLKMDELRLEALLTLNQMTGAPMEDLVGFSLEKAVMVTHSTLGYLAFLYQDESLRQMFTWPSTGPPESRTNCPGLWRESVKKRGSVVVDAPPEGTASPPGLPEGHPQIIRHMHIPIFDAGRIVIVAGVGNKRSPYTPRDIRQLTLLIQGMWAIFQRKLAQEERSAINRELARSLENLKNTQAHLVESEKMASLGALVAGVAHEINTPLGVGITEASFLEEKTGTLAVLLRGGKLKRSDLDQYLKNALGGTDNILRNLERAAELVENFKQVAVDRSSERRREFDLKKYVEDVMSSLHAQVKTCAPEVSINCDDPIVIDSYPGTFSQIITHLVMNSLIHGFEGKSDGRIAFELSCSDTELLFRYRDNGKGMVMESVRQIFDPFFTTRRTSGGTGLGMHIVYNLVTQKLGGQIRCSSTEGSGVAFTIRVPLRP